VGGGGTPVEGGTVCWAFFCQVNSARSGGQTRRFRSLGLGNCLSPGPATEKRRGSGFLTDHFHRINRLAGRLQKMAGFRGGPHSWGDSSRFMGDGPNRGGLWWGRQRGNGLSGAGAPVPGTDAFFRAVREGGGGTGGDGGTAIVDKTGTLLRFRTGGPFFGHDKYGAAVLTSFPVTSTSTGDGGDVDLILETCFHFPAQAVWANNYKREFAGNFTPGFGGTPGMCGGGRDKNPHANSFMETGTWESPRAGGLHSGGMLRCPFGIFIEPRGIERTGGNTFRDRGGRKPSIGLPRISSYDKIVEVRCQKPLPAERGARAFTSGTWGGGDRGTKNKN